MNNSYETKKALEDVKFIKDVLDRTSTSMSLLGKIFIYWGWLLLAASILYLSGSTIPVAGISSKLNFIQLLLLLACLLFIPMTILATVAIYKRISKNNPLRGLSKQLLTLWSCILFFLLAYSIVLAFSKTDFAIPSMFSVEVFSLSFGLLTISIFTGKKFPVILAAAYIIISLGVMLIGNSNLIIPIMFLLVPVTLIALGTHFNHQRVKVS